jgi:hypothetical protein
VKKLTRRFVYQLRGKGSLVNFEGTHEQRSPVVYATREAAEKRIDLVRDFLQRPDLMQLEDVKVDVLELEVIDDG